ncbi:MAG: DUF4430 domain-containing protein [Bradymonadia bacterium]
MTSLKTISVVCFAVFCLTAFACNKKGEDAQPAADNSQTKGQVTLTIEGPDGKVKTLPAQAWSAGLTVQGLLDAHKIKYDASGSGETALLTALDGVSNEGGQGKSWLFWVNDSFADKSFGAYTLKAGDVVKWKFALYAEGKKD